MRALILGGTGAMGLHVVAELADRGWSVAVTSRSERHSNRPEVTYLQGDAHRQEFLDRALAGGFDVVVDFMHRPTAEFEALHDKLLGSTGRYVFLSSYRVYADAPVLKEDSPRLLDVVDDPEYLATDEYALAKARCEDLLVHSGCSNWIVVRPAITYDGSGRFQLGPLESGAWLWRAQRGLPVPLPEAMLSKQATLTWGGDVARMIARLCEAEGIEGEAFTVATSEHHTWQELIDFYSELVPIEITRCDLGRFERSRGSVYQTRYDRMFNRVVDNTKVLGATGMQQADLVDTREGLQRELRSFLGSGRSLHPIASEQARLDKIGGGSSLPHLLREGVAPLDAAKWFVRRIL